MVEGQAAGMTQAYQFKPHERPVIPGSPFNPDHPSRRMWAYGAIGVLAGLTGGLGNALVTANLAFFQGTLGLTAEEAAWIPAAYVMTNVCANLLLVKFRQQFGLALFIRLVLVGYVLTALIHLFVHGFWSALLVRAVSGIAAAGLTTLCILAMFQAMPGPKRLYAILIGISIPQLANAAGPRACPRPARMGRLADGLFLRARAGAAHPCRRPDPAPPAQRAGQGPSIGPTSSPLGCCFRESCLLCAALGLGRTLWWTEAPWIGWALIGSIVLITAGIMVEHRRANPLLRPAGSANGSSSASQLSPSSSASCLPSRRSDRSACCPRSEWASTNSRRSTSSSPWPPSRASSRRSCIPAAISSARLIQIACLLIAVGAFLDSGATNLTRPANVYLSQALVGFGALLFIGPAMGIGISRTLLAGPQNFISWIVLFSATQNLGGLIGSAIVRDVPDGAREIPFA